MILNLLSRKLENFIYFDNQFHYGENISNNTKTLSSNFDVLPSPLFKII
jgi:hypothetical protein